MKKGFQFALFTCLMTGSLAAPALAQFQLPIKLPANSPQDTRKMASMDRNIQETRDKLQKWDDYLTAVAAQPRKVLERVGNPPSYDDLRRWTFTPPWPEMKAHPQYAEVSQKIRDLRPRVARLGLYVGEWKRWEYDGQQVGEAQLKFISSIEDKFNSMRSSSGVSDKLEKNLKFVADTLKRPEMESDPVLKVFRDQVAKPQLEGLVWHNAVVKIHYLEGAQKSLRDDFARSWKNCAKPCKERIWGETKRLVQYIDEVKAAGFDLKAHQIMSDPREPLSPTWNLEQLKAELSKILKAK
ncbi:hypothetical protein COW36_15800 [bacterium (Candidatus Blackallbacteria) CG17_big_fil_post_rev_8_21_14_2_50_48_46]|uniref:DUF885 domain-containing protein n=1 Tax=bacterium (Candidatus Blackallbacteria) CG17_big_fil_post_rev_8_21_14_2_50_48_46 TaxID=2014261 RepID=A0A2M7G314_9BACT|nr:MAG: hypothetical protein COW64_24310 [bacterium (Candidatus Blackallbacteria) CG18_big_fil_WC_8_21_14_2_50_49_26]PIW15808.1 MAG: hypothetical protein COW36_15800 [bacterium (Candidatus Blackallbacteria) CG17_big_fil_post_rev_8_21_14_2_50_48_46]PIW47793.1 MAG: hypothetical protein COW20_11495 [bacterium (Candidatus Blackallbacteria) CG13_big_fil_rev_8_21_14_2_50_49_14]